MFRIDNTDNIIDINTEDNLPTEYDQANIICPRYSTGTRQADLEKYIIYNVSRDEYENCRISNPNPRVIAVCDKPHQLMYFTITFRSFTPTPGGLEFKPGVDYFFISTSSRSDLYRKIGGRCTSHNMKLVFKVADQTRRRHSSNASVNNHVKAVNVPRTRTQYHHYSGGKESDIKTSERFPDTELLNSQQRGDDTLRRSTLTTLKDFHSYLYPMRDILDLDSNSVDHSKRSQDYVDTKPHKNHNEVIKQEASVMHSGVNSVFSQSMMCWKKRIFSIPSVTHSYSFVLICGIITSLITRLMNSGM
jgi:ephrin-B